MPNEELDKKLKARWYFGGLASAGAACCTHPLDLIKVHFQTTASLNVNATTKLAQTKTSPSLLSTGLKIVQNDGILALYSGLTASLLRQMTYSTTRFGIYEVIKQATTKDGKKMTMSQSVLFSGLAGACGGIVGTPADMMNVRMQNDMKLPINERRNYKNAFDGLIKVYRFEGATVLFNGAAMATARAVMMTIGQLSMYDQFKYMLLTYLPAIFQDNVITHLSASTLAGTVATTLTQPLDVLKTRMMNQAKNQYSSVGHCISDLYKESGLFGFFKGYVPAFTRLAPHTILTFVFYEQLRLNFGFVTSK